MGKDLEYDMGGPSRLGMQGVWNRKKGEEKIACTNLVVKMLGGQMEKMEETFLGSSRGRRHDMHYSGQRVMKNRRAEPWIPKRKLKQRERKTYRERIQI